MPEISIIIPVYNGEKYIQRCYDSIKNQDFCDYEIIFVDDESTDNSLLLLKKLEEKDPCVKVITQKNKRQGGARNTGLRAASGNYISFIDIDDYISPDFLSGLYGAIKKFDCDISAASIIRVKSGKKPRTLLKYTKEEAYTDKKEKAQIINGDGSGRGIWNKLFKKDFLIKNLLLFREYVFYEDCDYCAQAVFLANKIATTDKGNYFYFVNNKSTMRHRFNREKQNDKYIGTKLTAVFELKHGISEDFRIIPKFDWAICGLNLLRVKEKISLTESYEQFWLFDFIKIFERKIENI